MALDARVTDSKGHKLYDPGSGMVFVFGSNEAGIHGAGAALYARKWRGALQGIGQGPMPDRETPGCYAIPTKDKNLNTLSLDAIQRYVVKFLFYAASRPDLKFFVTRIGCGLAGLKDAQVAPLFAGAPSNCELHFVA